MNESRSPTLEEVLRVAFASMLMNVHTAIPGRIEKYDSGSQKADVKPLIKSVIQPQEGEEFLESIPIISAVPVMFPRTAGFFFSMNLAPGDLVLLVFCERSLDVWTQSSGEEVNPIDTRRFNYSDAVAIPGVFPFKKALQNAATSGVKFGSDDTSGMRVEVDGSKLIVTLGPGNTVTFESSEAGAKMTLGTGALSMALAEPLQILYTALSVWLASHTHLVTLPTQQSGPPTQAPAIPPWSPLIASTKVKVPNG